jgi:hypothetical protein
MATEARALYPSGSGELNLRTDRLVKNQPVLDNF